MGKKSRLKRERRAEADAAKAFWSDQAGIHTSFLVSGDPSPNAEYELTSAFQERIRNSPLWKVMVERFGEAKAEELLKQCKAEIKI